MNVLTEWLAARFPETAPAEFYRELFPSGQLCSAPYESGRYNGLIIRAWRGPDGVERAERHIVTDSLEQVPAVLALDGLFPRVSDLMSPVSYAGRRPRLDRAHELYALVFDLDGVTVEDSYPVGLVDLFHQMEVLPECPALLPTPTFTVSSGTGLHLYYLLDEPLRMWPDVCERLRLFRDAFTKRCWNRYVTDLSREPQLEGVVQAFRMVGSVSKSGDQVVRAFRTGNRVSVDEMNAYVPEQYRVTHAMRGARHSLEEARGLWPEWDPGWRAKAAAAPECPWRVKRDLFDWWCRRVEAGEPFEGNRYWCLFVAACYAAKCPEVTYEELEAWAYRVMPILDRLTTRPGNEFTAEDVQAALAAYGNPVSVKLRRDKVAEKTSLPMPVNKRNYLKQEQHLYLARRRKEDMKTLGVPLKNSDGRPKGSGTKRDAVRSYAAAHPGANHSEVARALGVSRPTVIKWLKDAPGRS